MNSINLKALDDGSGAHMALAMSVGGMTIAITVLVPNGPLRGPLPELQAIVLEEACLLLTERAAALRTEGGPKQPV